MLKNYLFSVILFITLASVLPSCISVKSTFEEDYTSTIKVKPDKFAVLSPDNQSLYLAGTSTSLINSAGVLTFSKIISANGTTSWTSDVHKLGDMVKSPESVVMIEDESVVLVFGIRQGNLLSPSQFQISAIDVNSRKQLWSRSERNPSGFSSGGFYLPKNKSFVIQTPDGMQSFDIKTGKVLWSIDDLSVRLNIVNSSLRILQSNDINFYYLEELDRFIFDAKGKVSLFNPYSGEYDWQIEENIGGHTDADFFIKEGLAVFYGHNSRQTNQNISDNSGVVRTMSRATNALESGIRLNPVYLIDLNSGEIKWKNNFHTNGQSKVTLTEEKLLVSGIVSYAFDLTTGEKTWQNVTEQRLNIEGLYSLFAEFTGFDLSAGGKTVKNAVVIDNSIFVIYPELFDKVGNRNQVSIRLYDFVSGELLWKSEAQRMIVRDFFLDAGVLFVVIDGRYSRGSKILALDPYTGEKMYEIESREPLNNLIITDNLIYHLNVLGKLTIYNVRSGQIVDSENLGKIVVDIIDMNNKLLVVYRVINSRENIMAFHDKNTFNIISQVKVPFYSRNFVTVNNKLFMIYDSEKFKGVIHLDLDQMKVHNHASVSTKRSTRVKGQSRNIVLDPYQYIIDSDASFLYHIQKKKLVRYKI